MVKQLVIIAFFCFLGYVLPAQAQLLSAKNSEIDFFSKTPLEDIKALNTKSSSIINTENGEIVVKIPVNQFQFSNKLMQQHFNENYLESEKYPNATFKGKINEVINFTQSGTYEVSASGTLNIHGVNQERTIKGKISISEGLINLNTKFDVLLVDHKINIPKIVFKKIAEQIAVSARITYIPNKK
jgi:hypothetical protein